MCSQVPAMNRCPRGRSVCQLPLPWSGSTAIKQLGCDHRWTGLEHIKLSPWQAADAAACAFQMKVVLLQQWLKTRAAPQETTLSLSYFLLKYIFSAFILGVLRLPPLWWNPRTLHETMLKHEVWTLQIFMSQITSASSGFFLMGQDDREHVEAHKQTS